MRRSFLFVCMMVSLFPFGCSGGAGNIKLAPVKGQVTMGGKPVEGAVVSFNLEGAPRAAVGETDAEGKYSLTMFDKDDGAALGQNVVLITGAETPAAPSNSDDYAKVMGIGGNAPPKSTKTIVPPKYADAKKALLKVNVTAGANVHDFKLQE